jgi:hypothetical protein
MEQKDKLYCISYGASATSEIERDVIFAEAFGADAKVDNRIRKQVVILILIRISVVIWFQGLISIER